MKLRRAAITAVLSALLLTAGACGDDSRVEAACAALQDVHDAVGALAAEAKGEGQGADLGGPAGRDLVNDLDQFSEAANRSGVEPLKKAASDAKAHVAAAHGIAERKVDPQPFSLPPTPTPASPAATDSGSGMNESLRTVLRESDARIRAEQATRDAASRARYEQWRAAMGSAFGRLDDAGRECERRGFRIEAPQ